MEQHLKPSNFTLLQDCAELVDLAVDGPKDQLTLKMEQLANKMSQLRQDLAKMPGINISQKDQNKVLSSLLQ